MIQVYKTLFKRNTISVIIKFLFVWESYFSMVILPVYYKVCDLCSFLQMCFRPDVLLCRLKAVNGQVFFLI